MSEVPIAVVNFDSSNHFVGLQVESLTDLQFKNQSSRSLVFDFDYLNNNEKTKSPKLISVSSPNSTDLASIPFIATSPNILLPSYLGVDLKKSLENWTSPIKNLKNYGITVTAGTPPLNTKNVVKWFISDTLKRDLNSIKDNFENLINDGDINLDSNFGEIRIDLKLSHAKELPELQSIQNTEVKDFTIEQILHLKTQVLTLDGKFYKIKLVEVSNENITENYTQTLNVDGISQTTLDVKISNQSEIIPETKREDWIYKYNPKTGVIKVGPIEFNKIRRSGLTHKVLKKISNCDHHLRKEWLFDDLIEILEPNSKIILGKGEKGFHEKLYQAFYYLQSVLPESINDLFILNTESICINDRYILNGEFSS